MKRIFDLALALLLLVALAPVMLLVALIVLACLGRPVFFRQIRPGLGCRPFELVKFRTMSMADSSSDAVESDEQRLGRLGRWLRASSLDELPELINIVRGDMSFVGPRPLLMEYLPRYNAEQKRRHDVRPGLTGWAQIHGRNALGWSERFALDVWYVDNQSFLLDLKILALSVVKVLRREGIAQEGKATMEPFRGNSE